MCGSSEIEGGVVDGVDEHGSNALVVDAYDLLGRHLEPLGRRALPFAHFRFVQFATVRPLNRC